MYTHKRSGLEAIIWNARIFSINIQFANVKQSASHFQASARSVEKLQRAVLARLQAAQLYPLLRTRFSAQLDSCTEAKSDSRQHSHDDGVLQISATCKSDATARKWDRLTRRYSFVGFVAELGSATNTLSCVCR